MSRWPECAPDEYNPKCCRFPKSCSCVSVDVAGVDEAIYDITAVLPEHDTEGWRS